MIEITGDIWDMHKLGYWIAITTNGSVRNDGAAVMGRGVAREAAQRYPELQAKLGWRIKKWGNQVWVFGEWRIFTLPVKHRWMEKASLDLIVTSLNQLVETINMRTSQTSTASTVAYPTIPVKVYLVRPGCGNGGLLWKDVKPVIEPILDDRFIIVERKKDE